MPSLPDPAPVDAVASAADRLFSQRVQHAPSAPFITFYDDASGERAELSAKSLGNWVAKTHFLLTDSLGLGPGDQAAVSLPVHWLAAPILFGCWFAGLQVLSRPPTGGAQVLFADAGSLAELAPAGPAEAGLAGAGLADDVFAVSLLSMARPDQPPPGADDFTSAVRPMPDAWQSVRARSTPADPALDELSHRELVSMAGQLANELGLVSGGRLLWTGRAPSLDRACPPTMALALMLLAPLAVDASLVLVRNADPAGLDRRVVAERVTVVH